MCVMVLSAVGLFVSQAAHGALPDHRSWELVTPSDKNGGDVEIAGPFTRAAASGGALEFASPTGFGDARGTGIFTEYESIRTAKPGTSGWVTHGITPGPLEALSPFDEVFAAFQPRYMGMFSSDLSDGVFASTLSSPLTADSPFTESTPNIYLRKDLRTPGLGVYRLLSDCPACSAPLPGSQDDVPDFVGASADFSHVVFESVQSLTSDVPPCDPGPDGSNCPSHLYEWVNGAVRLAGILPAGEGGGPAPNSQAGQGARFGAVPDANAADAPGTISEDGRRVFFTVRGTHDTASGQLYMRQDGSTTIRISASEKTTPDPVPMDATSWWASPDGSKALFTTDENLVDSDATSETAPDLYLYDADAPAAHRLTLVSIDQHPSDGIGAAVDGVMGMSDDGNYVYFVARGQLAPGGPSGGSEDRLFVWHRAGTVETVHEVGDVTGGAQFVIGGSWRLAKRGYVTPDGRRAVFASPGDGSTAELPHSGSSDTCDAGECREVYVYDAAANDGTGQLTCASCHPGNPDAPSATQADVFVDQLGLKGYASAVVNRPLSADGRFVFFTAGDPLVSADKNHMSDVYEFDTATGQVHLLSSGAADSQGSFFLDASSDGRDAFFATRDRLVGWDVDQQYDVYDARVDGGMPDPPPASIPCVADGCRTGLHAPSSVTLPATSAFAGHGNVTAAKRHSTRKRCRKGRVRRRVHGKVRCVKRHRSHHAAKRALTRKGQ